MRDDGSPGLASGGQLGGGQAGVRVRYGLSPNLALAARLSGPLASALGKEAALAVDWRPSPAAPITLTIERRVGLDRGGRDAFAAGLYGGFDRKRIGANIELDGYAQAGMVGAKRRDFFVDGALRAERRVAPGSRIAFGAGIWSGAQPGVARLDIGPQLVVRVPVDRGGLRIGAEWRVRIAGDARPDSGPALSIGADF